MKNAVDIIITAYIASAAYGNSHEPNRPAS